MRPLKQPPGSLFRGGELMRLMAMVGMLVVLGMLIYRARDAAMWRWIAPAPEDPPQQVAGKELNEDGSKKGPGVAKDAAGQLPTDPQAGPAVAPPVPTGPTDEDPEEWDAALEEFEAVSDRTLGMHVEEMQAYWRLVRWTQHQEQPLLRARARKDLFFTHLMLAPEEYRGQLVHLDLNVRRVLRHEAPENKADQETIYELWGWTNESKAWLYVVITPELPPGMPIGPDVYETVRFDGYFLKLLGYHEAGAGPRDEPLAAPLLVGRVSWRPMPSIRSRPNTGVWSWVLNGVILAIAIGSVVWFFTRKRAVPKADIREEEAETLDQWLDEASEPGVFDAHRLQDDDDEPSYMDILGRSNGEPPRRPGD